MSCPRCGCVDRFVEGESACPSCGEGISACWGEAALEEERVELDESRWLEIPAAQRVDLWIRCPACELRAWAPRGRGHCERCDLPLAFDWESAPAAVLQG